MGYPKIENRAKALAAKIVALWKNAGSPTYIVQSENERQFIESLPENQKQPLINALELCESEIETLSQNYGVTTIAKKLQPIYRKAISEVSGVTQYRSLPLALFTYSGTKQVNDDSRSKVETRVDELIPVTESQLEQWKSIAVDFLFSESDGIDAIARLMLGLSMLTGRRLYVEIGVTAKFYPVLGDDMKVVTNRLQFYGQAKSGVERSEQGYEIETLFDGQDIIDGLADLREMISETYGSVDSDYLQSVLHKNVEKIIRSELLPIFSETINAGYPVGLVAKDSRKLYATITHNDFVKRTGKRVSFENFAAKLLGHVKTSKLGNQFKDTQTSRSYNKFAVVTGETIPAKSLYWS